MGGGAPLAVFWAAGARSAWPGAGLMHFRFDAFPPGAPVATDSAALGLRVAHEVFAERGYAADGTLLPRGVAGAVLDDSGEAVTQALRLVRDGMVIADNGAQLALRADTLCLHGDRDHAAAFARALRIALEQAGILILGLGVTE